MKSAIWIIWLFLRLLWTLLANTGGIEREVKKATRDLNQLLTNIESPMTRLETVHKKYTELLADMKKLDRDYAKSKKRADQLQKDQDKGKSELNKTVTMKDKLEKLCRELTKENKKVKVGLIWISPLRLLYWV
jgi:DNA repair ATPase RecN